MESCRIAHDPILCLGNQTNHDLQAEELLDRLGAQVELAPNTRRKLLERLLARGRFEDALLVLQP